LLPFLKTYAVDRNKDVIPESRITELLFGSYRILQCIVQVQMR
jgi:hypothetical protein